MRKYKILPIILVLAIVLCGCSMQNNSNIQPEEEITVSYSADDIISSADMFTDRDLNYDYSDRDVYKIALKDNKSKSDSTNVEIKNNVITIKSEGVYVLSGSLSNGQIIIDANDSDKVQLVLNSVNINCNTSASIYCKNAKKLFVTTVGDSTLSNKNDFVNDNDEKINGVIYSKADLTLNGSNKLTINAKYGNAVVSNDDLMITSGDYALTAEKHTIKANDSVRIANASFNLTATKDAIHCENDEVTKGYVYIESGSVTINAESDGIEASSAIKICDGTIDIQSSKEGIEGRFIEVAGGDINITSSDDGFNASDKSEENNNSNSQANQTESTPPTPPENSQQAPPEMPSNNNGEMKEPPSAPQGNNGNENNEPPANMEKGGFGKMGEGSTDCSLTISGGNITVNADGDGLDSNGIIKITGGQTVVYGAENNGNCAFDYQTGATITGGSIIALGMSGMAEGFSNSSTQGSILYNIDTEGSKDDTIELLQNNKSIISTVATKKYNSILISTPEINKGKYTIIAGSIKEKIKIKNKSYSNSKEDSFGMRDKKPKEDFGKDNSKVNND